MDPKVSHNGGRTVIKCPNLANNIKLWPCKKEKIQFFNCTLPWMNIFTYINFLFSWFLTIPVDRERTTILLPRLSPDPWSWSQLAVQSWPKISSSPGHASMQGAARAQCSAVQCDLVQLIVVQCFEVEFRGRVECSAVFFLPVQYKTVHYSAVHCCLFYSIAAQSSAVLSSAVRCSAV